MIKFDEGEYIVKTVRKHWFVMLFVALTMLTLAVLPLILYFFIFFELSDFIFTENALIPNEVLNLILAVIGKWGAFAYTLWLLILWTLFFVEWTDYYLDVWVITNKRVIDVEQKGFFNREITSFRYAQIQDITTDVKGVIQTLLKFGMIRIETAGDDLGRDIAIKYADRPEEARSIILKEQEKSK